MATKTIAWTTGSGNITLTYTGQGNGSISVASDENDSFEERSQSFQIVNTNGSPEKAIDILVKQAGKTYSVGEVFNFDYTGTVQQIILPKGRYKLQCWGAQGGTSYGSSSGTGSKGGYSEGVLTLTQKTTLYIFVGGAGSRGSSTSLVNGGWNGGGASIGYTSYDSGDTKGYSYPACGGGATDISTVTSSMSYSGGRTNRSAASLLARCIVAGGGAGGSYRHTTVTTTTTGPSTTVTNWETFRSYSGLSTSAYAANGYYQASYKFYPTSANDTYRLTDISPSGYMSADISASSGLFTIRYSMDEFSSHPSVSCTIEKQVTTTIPGETTTETSTSSGYSNKSQQGGGTSGKGQYPGTQSAGGNGNGNDGGFGYGGNQSVSGYRYASGGGGGGWYGGGTAYSDSSTSYVNYTGGGSGFVNTAANASYRPSGYAGLQLDSGSTTAGDASHPSTSGGTEKGHSGNGYARITVLSSQYTTIPYIEATGTQYMDTGFVPTINTTVVANLLIPSGVGNKNLFCAYTNFALNSMSNNKLEYRLGTGNWTQIATPSPVTSRFDVEFNCKEIKFNGTVIASPNLSSLSNTYTLWLFSRSGGASTYYGHARIYSLKIYDNGIIVRDYIPTLSPDGVAGLWDNVNKVFYKSVSGSEFIAGT